MKRIACFSLSLCAMLAMVSCKSTQSAYQQAYEKAVQNDVVTADAAETAPAAVPTTAKPEYVPAVQVREEKVTVVTGETALKAYGLVCGSFSLKTNADALRQRLIGDGYPAIVVVNEAGKTYRVICNSFDTKAEAVDARSAFKAKYPDNQDFQAAWILYRK